jgi:demethylmenaquinone methyltransferase/2-methoxy-6-polyprenyl-1,4-benzoquinol methylase
MAVVTTARGHDGATEIGVLPEERDKPVTVEAMFDRISPRYDLLNRLLTFGLDTRWRRATVASLSEGGGLARGSLVLDVACGTGDLCRDLMHDGYRAVGIDFSTGMLGSARTSAPLVRGDALALPIARGLVDGVTCGFALRNFAAIEPFLAECARALRHGGRIALLEVAEPHQPLLRAGHSVYFRRIVPFVGGLLSDRAAYRYLPASTAYLPPPAALCRAVAEAGFTDVRRRLLAPGAAQLVTGSRS